MPTFDIVSKYDIQEVENSVNMVTRDITNRYDFRGSDTTITFNKKEGIQVNEIDGIDQAVSMFRLYRVDGIAAPCLTADAEFERQKVDKEQFVKLAPPLVTKNYYLMLSKQFVTKHPKLSTKIWRISNKVAINNYPSIVKKYITVQHN